MTIDNINDAPADAADAFLFAVDALREIQSAMAGLAAMETSLYAAVFARAEELTAVLPSPVTEREMALRTACAEIGAALRVSDRTVQRRLSNAWDVTTNLPQTFEALRQGRITQAHVNTIIRASEGLPAGRAREMYDEAAVERAEQLSPNRLAAVLPAVAAQIHECGMAERHQRARRHRRVEIRDIEDGMSELLAVLPAVIAHGIHDRLTSMAKACETAHGGDGAVADTVGIDASAGNSTAGEIDDRSRDEIRADIFGDLLLGGGPIAAGEGLAAITAQIQISIPVLTAAGVTDRGAELIGTGPIDTETARRLVGAASGWDRVMTCPVTGTILAVDRYRPSEDLRRTLRVRDEHCRFPGCRQPAHRTDADHSLAAADGGPTSLDNMALLCRRHHVMKHAAAWTITHQGNGILKWTSPSGRTYIDTPTPTLRFFPTGPDPDNPGEPDDPREPNEPGEPNAPGVPDIPRDPREPEDPGNSGADSAARMEANIKTDTEAETDAEAEAEARRSARLAARWRAAMGEGFDGPAAGPPPY